MTEHLAELERVAKRKRSAEAAYMTALLAAREAGATYSELARAAGTSRQNVRQVMERRIRGAA